MAWAETGMVELQVGPRFRDRRPAPPPPQFSSSLETLCAIPFTYDSSWAFWTVILASLLEFCVSFESCYRPSGPFPTAAVVPASSSCSPGLAWPPPAGPGPNPSCRLIGCLLALASVHNQQRMTGKVNYDATEGVRGALRQVLRDFQSQCLKYWGGGGSFLPHHSQVHKWLLKYHNP